MELISIIMGVYNCEKTVSQAIESILDQTYENWELIICDDCSTDNTFIIVDEFRRRFPEKITLMQNEHNMRLSYTLNRCLDHSKGYYIARMDGDDISRKDRLEKQVKYLKEHPGIQLVGTGNAAVQ